MSSGRFDIGSLDSYEEAKKCSVCMIIDNTLLDKLTAQAKESPRLRMNMDLRNSAADSSRRMLNVLMTDTVIPNHRHTETSETVIVCRGKVREEFYDAEGNKTAEFVMEAGGECPGIQVPMGRAVPHIGLPGGRQRDLRGKGQALRSGGDGGIFGEAGF